MIAPFNGADKRRNAEPVPNLAEPTRAGARLREIAAAHPARQTGTALGEVADLFEAVLDRLLWVEAACRVLLDEHGLAAFPVVTAEVPL